MLFRVPIVFRREILIRRQNVRSLDPSPLRFLIPPSFAPVRNPVSSGNVRLPAGKRRPLALLPPPPRSAGCGHCLRATPRRKEPPSGAVERPPSFPAGKGGPIPFDRSRQRKDPIRTRPPRNAAPERYAPNASPPAGEPTGGKPLSRESVALSTPARHRKTKTRPGKHERTKYKKSRSLCERPYVSCG